MCCSIWQNTCRRLLHEAGDGNRKETVALMQVHILGCFVQTRTTVCDHCFNRERAILESGKWIDRLMLA
jgi:hypothetical protein